MLKFHDLLELSGLKLTDFKIHCATGSGWLPLDAYFEGRFKEWQEHQTKKNFECEHVVSLIHLRGSEWLFAGVWEILDSKARMTKGKRWYEYSTMEVAGLEHLSGRAIVHFDRSFRNSYLRDPKYLAQLKVRALLPERMTIEDFPGFSHICISYDRLCTVVRQSVESWRSALSSVNGVYNIADTHKGYQYIGSAYGAGGIWSRWANYAKNGHGGNKELRRLLSERGSEYAENFQFSVLEICDPIMSRDQVIARESHWKECLLTRRFGYNEN